MNRGGEGNTSWRATKPVQRGETKNTVTRAPPQIKVTDEWPHSNKGQARAQIKEGKGTGRYKRFAWDMELKNHL